MPHVWAGSGLFKLHRHRDLVKEEGITQEGCKEISGGKNVKQRRYHQSDERICRQERQTTLAEKYKLA